MSQGTGQRVAAMALACVVLVSVATGCAPTKKVDARAGANQITVTTAPNALVGLYDRSGRLVPTLLLPDEGDPQPVDFQRTDANGNLVLRYVPIGSGYTVRRVDSTRTEPSDPVTVHSKDWGPDRSLYTNQKINVGYGYLRTRDDTLLSYMVRLPGPADKGPYPTLVTYSGYDPSDPYDAAGADVFNQIGPALGYAVVGINVRGSGCSGGSLLLFEDAMAADGYDAVETIAAQPWVKGNKVGLVGLSYSGNTALYAAATRPPSLAGVVAGGLFDDAFRTMLRPAGILNEEWTKNWVVQRYAESNPATAPAWVKRRIAEGDEVCAFNQRMRLQNIDLSTRLESEPYQPTLRALADSFSPATFVHKITAPVLLVVGWQDDGTGGHAASMLDRFTSAKSRHFLLTNGVHAEMFASPEIFQRWDEFLSLYVKRQVPDGATAKAIAPFVTKLVLGTADPVTSIPFPPARFAGKTLTQALASYEIEPSVRVLFENGGAPGQAPGLPQAAFARDFSSYPVPGTTATRWWLGPDGTLTSTAPTAADDADDTTDTYVSDPAARPKTMAGTLDPWSQIPDVNWTPPVPGKSLSYLTEPLTADTTMIGSGSIDLWLRSDAPDTDLQVTLTEVRPDGKETYVQTGWLRASVRALDPARSTELQPRITMLERDAAPLPPGTFTPVRIELYPFAHAFRAGSQVRIIITAPGGDRFRWGFQTLPGTQTNEIARSVGRPSSVVLPVVAGVTVPTPLPPCPGLRAQPCRPAA